MRSSIMYVFKWQNIEMSLGVWDVGLLVYHVGLRDC